MCRHRPHPPTSFLWSGYPGRLTVLLLFVCLQSPFRLGMPCSHSHIDRYLFSTYYAAGPAPSIS